MVTSYNPGSVKTMRKGIKLCSIVLLACSAISCKSLEADLPAGVTDPDLVKTWPNAMASLVGVREVAKEAFVRYVTGTGFLTDELRGWAYENTHLVDSRTAGDHWSIVYGGLNSVRNNAVNVISLFNEVGKDSSQLQRSELYSLYSLSEVMLAELFCSGIPLSLIEYGGDYNLTTGFSTVEVLQHSMALADTAIQLAGDDENLRSLSLLVKARALLMLDSLDAAASLVESVDSKYEYILEVLRWSAPHNNSEQSLHVMNREGINGLPWVEADDPRVELESWRNGSQDNYRPIKYMPEPYNNRSRMPVVSGLEGRLIIAEALLRKGNVGGWIDELNNLRRNHLDAAMPDTFAPADEIAQVDLHFYERAFWLFLTGRRQADFRRLQLYYGRDPETLYPRGSYNTTTEYGDVIVAPVPEYEFLNKQYTGCFHHGP